MNSTERAHAILSPSFMHIALECAGSIGIKEKVPQEPAGPAAIKGTLMHEAASDRLSRLLDMKIEGTNLVLPLIQDPEVEKVAAGWTATIWEKAFERSVTGKVYGIEEKLIFSEKFSLYGTTDFWMVSTDERAKPYGMVCDLKSGFIFVDANKNAQLAAYACALRKTVRDCGKDLDYVRTAIYQPFAEGDKYRETRFTGKQLDIWEKKFLKLAETVFTNKAKFKAGDHCMFCPGRLPGRCSTYDAYRTKQTGLKMLEPSEFKFPDIAETPTELLVKIFKHEDHIDSVLKACKKELLNRLLSGKTADGVKLVQAKTRRKWDEDKIPQLEAALAKEGVSLMESTPKGLTDVKDSLSERFTKKESEELLSPFIVSPPGGIVLADASDARDSVKPTQGMFSAIEE